MENELAYVLATTRSGFPSPSRSAITVATGLGTFKFTPGANVEASIAAPLPAKVGSNAATLYATRPFTVTVIGAYVAPVGTVTKRFVGLADETIARTAPK